MRDESFVLSGRRRALAALVGLVLACPAGAQVLTVTVRDVSAGAAVAGAIVTATNRVTGARVDGLTSDAGRVSLRLPGAGEWSASVRRIGIVPKALPAVAVGEGATVAVSINVTNARFTLSPVRVTAVAVCGSAPRGADRTAALWEQISLALRTSELTRVDSVNAPRLRATIYERMLDGDLGAHGTRVLSTGIAAPRTFFAADPEFLERHGYIRRDRDGDVSYFAPDETVMLSDGFLRTHCFSTPETDADPALAELEFRPVPRRKQPEIAGVAYVDTLSGELRRIVYRYVNAKSFLPPYAVHSGGEVKLSRLANGQWIVAEWTIRMPRLFLRSWASRASNLGYREAGGLVKTEEQAIADSLVWAAQRAAEDSAALFGERADRWRIVTRDDPSIQGIIRSATVAGRPRLYFLDAKTVELRTGFARARASGDGVYLDSAAIARLDATTALDLVFRAPGVIPFVVPMNLSGPSAWFDFLLAAEWRPGVTLPMMLIAKAETGATPGVISDGDTRLCYPKVFLDNGMIPLTRDEMEQLRSVQIATMVIHAPYSAAATRTRSNGFSEFSGNVCGTIHLRSYIDYRR